MKSTLFVISLALILLFSAASAYAENPPEFILQWGSAGSDEGQFNSPLGIACGRQGNVYVVDGFNNRIQVFNSNGQFLFKWGSSGSGEGQFNFPFGIAADASGNVYVTDYGNNRVQKFSSTGQFLLAWGSLGCGNGQFNMPLGIDVDTNGFVYVVEQDNNRVQKFTSHGCFVGKWGSQGSGNGKFYWPLGITVSADNIYVADTHNNRVQVFDPTGKFLFKWGSSGSGDGQFNYPFGLAVDSCGHVYVTDMENHRLQVFDSKGKFLFKWGSPGSGQGQFNEPWDVAIDSQNNIYVLEHENCRIQKFGHTPVAVLLTNLMAERREQTVVIHWSVSSSYAAEAAFQVYRETGNGTREKLTEQALENQADYEFVDATAPAGKLNYWLEEVGEKENRWHGPIEVEAMPSLAMLLSAFPNPFNPATTITYIVPVSGTIELSVYDVSGKLVQTLINHERKNAGQYQLVYQHKGSSGVYFVKLSSGKENRTQKIVVLQ